MQKNFSVAICSHIKNENILNCFIFLNSISIVTIQRRWLLFLTIILIFSHLSKILQDERKRRDEIEKQVFAVIKLQKFIRNTMNKKRKIKCIYYCNNIKSLLNICLFNVKINKYNRVL